ncbi:caspase family protein [Sorangium sp. So ce1000]|uniref:caspase family protein n=1 Tax=Sorangium sp. So ce1000 TaxID=3133325 RepID=UPI003F634651
MSTHRNGTPQKSATGISLHLGLNFVDEGHYGSKLPLTGCHNDARDMQYIADEAGYQSTLLLDESCTATRVLESVSDAARQLRTGDSFLITYAGHGTQVPDESDDEVDGNDEAWVLFDRLLLDDEIYVALAAFAPGVRVLVISDSCHSGSITRRAEWARSEAMRAHELAARVYRTPSDPNFGSSVVSRNRSRYAGIVRSTPRNPRELVRAAMIQISACQDDQLAADGQGNGLFTSKLKDVWSSGNFRGSHRAFWQRIARLMPASQSPNYLLSGEGAAVVEAERPFTIALIQNSNTQPEKGIIQMSDHELSQGNWTEVCAELQRRFPDIKLPPALLAGYTPATTSDSFITSSNDLPTAPRTTRAATGAPIVRAFFWGFHIEISSQSLREFLSVADPINAIVAALGPITGPAAPFVALAAAFIAGALQLLRGLDRGNGVYVSMSWFAPLVFIPTTVPANRQSSAAIAKRDPGEPYEQAGDPWRRDYGGGLFGLRLEEDIYWNLPEGTVREQVIVHLNPPGFGNIHFNDWLSPDPTVGHFRLHVGVRAFWGGRVELRMMIRDAAGRRSIVTSEAPGPRAFTAAEIEESSAHSSARSASSAHSSMNGGHVGHAAGVTAAD